MSIAVTTRARTIGPGDHGRTITLEEYLKAEVLEGGRYELDWGTIDVSDVPDWPHLMVLMALRQAVVLYRVARPDVVLAFGGASELRVIVPAFESERRPDFGVVIVGAPPIGGGAYEATLLAEVLSESTRERDLVAKREEYLAYGAREYWIVDPFAKRVIVLTRVDGPPPAWEERVLVGDDAIETALMPGFRLTLADLWARLDEYERGAAPRQ